MNFELGMRNLRYISLYLCVSVAILSCSSTQPVIGKLDLSSEKQMILDSMDIPEVKKQFIVNTFDKAESFCNDTVALVNTLYKTIETQKATITKLDEQAKIYRTVRNWLIGFILIYLIWKTSKFWLPIVKRLLGIPV